MQSGLNNGGEYADTVAAAAARWIVSGNAGTGPSVSLLDGLRSAAEKKQKAEEAVGEVAEEVAEEMAEEVAEEHAATRSSTEKVMVSAEGEILAPRASSAKATATMATSAPKVEGVSEVEVQANSRKHDEVRVPY